MEPYLIFCWSIKWGDISFLQNTMQELTNILQAPSAKKPKYARKMLRQMYILDTNAIDLIL